ncbi:hypothetical protein F0562_017584 [Nyssa sinensis]|uniref:Uncharacterized protein n=1 Tax=Nyssa sinensis TaxID=561372 RepID=A0A5J4ZJA1_9ASTE|nr:hypothetical protein F0562_017584 [Nyssa sinensis]
MEESRNRVYSVVDELRSCYLLLADDEDFVKLHDVVRDVDVSIASKGERVYMLGLFPQYRFQNSLRLSGLDMSVLLETGIKVLLKRTEILTLEVKGLRNVLNELDVEGFINLKELLLHNCADVEYLIDAMNVVLDSAFVNLESLNLQFKALVQLQELTISECDVMEEIVAKEGGEDEKGADRKD